jgi:hypothetical protein
MRACIRKSYHFFLNLANTHPSVALVPFPDRSTATEKALVIHMAHLSAMVTLARNGVGEIDPPWSQRIYQSRFEPWTNA